MAVVDKLKGGKSVLQRTKPGKDLPRLALYVGVAPAGYSVRGPDGSEHVLTSQILASQYKVASGKKAAALIAEHWPPARAAEPDAEKKAAPGSGKDEAATKTSSKKTAAKKQPAAEKTATKKKTSKKKTAKKTSRDIA